MKKLLRRIIHPFVYWYYKKIVKKIYGLLQYVVLMDLIFNKDKYRERYINGENYLDMIIATSKTTADKLTKSISYIARREAREKRRKTMSVNDRIELIRRYERFTSVIIKNAEKAALNKEIEEAEIAYQEHLKKS